MSLRSQLHDALDEVTPPAPALESKVENFVLARDRGRGILVRHGRGPWTRRFRGTLTALAAVLVVVLIGGVFFGGRYWRDLNAPPATVDQSELKGLEARPLSFPTVAPGAQCPVSRIKLQQYGLAVGDGPVYYWDSDVQTITQWGRWKALSLGYNVTAPGLVLIRIKDLQTTDAVVAFAQFPLGPSGVIATGSVLGSDQAIDRTLQMRREAIIQDPSHTKRDKQGNLPPLKVMLGVSANASGCVGFQIDGPNFTERFIIDARAMGL
jgi:hypothetical protein